MESKKLLLGAAVAVPLVAASVWFATKQTALAPDASQAAVEEVASGEMVAVNMPELASEYLVGAAVFKAKCAACHGPNAGGLLGAGPPLIHKIYEPSHHADIAFYLAAQQGVRAHHWKFGNMPPVEGVTKAEVTEVVAFLRFVQRENGIQ